MIIDSNADDITVDNFFTERGSDERKQNNQIQSLASMLEQNMLSNRTSLNEAQKFKLVDNF